MPIKATIWNEYRHEVKHERCREIYPNGIHGALADCLRAVKDGGNDVFAVRTATLDEPEHGLTESVLADTDVLLWWGHMAHKEVSDDIVARVVKRVQEGMGLVVLHSGHASKVFSTLLGTDTSMLRWRENEEKQRFWLVSPGHPIAQGVPETFTLPAEETYGEFFNIPQPDELIFISWTPGGNVFRSGCLFTRGAGRIFYFQPGHETFPSYYDPNVCRVIANAARFTACAEAREVFTGHEPQPLEG